MVCIIDYGLGNLGSLQNMLKRIDSSVIISSAKDDIAKADKLILPGVGTFDTGVTNLNSLGLIEILNDEVLEKKKKILGICLGAQLMLNSSEEGNEKGLSWVDGKVIRFNSSTGIKIPHMGWNDLQDNKSELFNNMPESPARFYFVHSYHFLFENQDYSTSTVMYGHKFSASFNRDNIFGVQFHPEKSHQFGLNLLKNFIAL
ncbi:MAG TPA: imidazole glycerol phosphate synthase subunit HisH [Flavipsychrobacter sp.]|nr:imidazole glycerol phosphate synthase subunit HisH [Flavipsychrobacter sp.]